MLNLKDLFSRGKRSGEAEEGGSAPKSSKGPAKLSAALSFLPAIKDIFSAKKQLVGLDIGSSSLKVAELNETKTGYILNHFSQISLEKGIIEDGIVVDPEALRQKIKLLFKGTALQRKGIVSSLSGHATIIKKVTLPNMEETELHDLIRDEASKYLPFDNMDDVNYDFQILGQDEYNPNQMEVIIVAAKKDTIESYTDAIEGAGLPVMIMDVDTFALETMYEANYDFEETDVVAMVNIGAGITSINVVKNGLSIFTRDFTLAGNAVTEAIQAAHGLTFEAAEQMKIEGPQGDETTRQAFRDSLLGFADPICTEIERSIDYFRSTSGGENIRGILLSGGTAAIPRITADLSNRLGIETDILDPFRKIEYNSKVISPERLEQIRPIAAVAVGLALRKLGDK